MAPPTASKVEELITLIGKVRNIPGAAKKLAAATNGKLTETDAEVLLTATDEEVTALYLTNHPHISPADNPSATTQVPPHTTPATKGTPYVTK